MVVALSYVLAVLITVALAIVLYPIAGLFWVFGLLGKLSDGLFKFTKKTIAALWRDLKNTEQEANTNKTPMIDTMNTWTCACGAVSTGKFCTECGCSKPEESSIEVSAEIENETYEARKLQ